MDFPDTFDFSVVSDSQAYKQAGNSIVVNVLYKILLQITKNKNTQWIRK
jgi:site-specific DNA-cytosine methylase